MARCGQLSLRARVSSSQLDEGWRALVIAFCLGLPTESLVYQALLALARGMGLTHTALFKKIRSKPTIIPAQGPFATVCVEQKLDFYFDINDLLASFRSATARDIAQSLVNAGPGDTERVKQAVEKLPDSFPARESIRRMCGYLPRFAKAMRPAGLPDSGTAVPELNRALRSTHREWVANGLMNSVKTAAAYGEPHDDHIGPVGVIKRLTETIVVFREPLAVPELDAGEDVGLARALDIANSPENCAFTLALLVNSGSCPRFRALTARARAARVLNDLLPDSLENRIAAFSRLMQARANGEVDEYFGLADPPMSSLPSVYTSATHAWFRRINLRTHAGEGRQMCHVVSHRLINAVIRHHEIVMSFGTAMMMFAAINGTCANVIEKTADDNQLDDVIDRWTVAQLDNAAAQIEVTDKSCADRLELQWRLARTMQLPVSVLTVLDQLFERMTLSGAALKAPAVQI
jgi:hypothetical protein